MAEHPSLLPPMSEDLGPYRFVLDPATGKMAVKVDPAWWASLSRQERRQRERELRKALAKASEGSPFTLDGSAS